MSEPTENSGFECREKNCTRDALLGSYYCEKHDRLVGGQGERGN